MTTRERERRTLRKSSKVLKNTEFILNRNTDIIRNGHESLIHDFKFNFYNRQKFFKGFHHVNIFTNYNLTESLHTGCLLLFELVLHLAQESIQLSLEVAHFSILFLHYLVSHFSFLHQFRLQHFNFSQVWLLAFEVGGLGPFFTLFFEEFDSPNQELDFVNKVHVAALHGCFEYLLQSRLLGLELCHLLLELPFVVLNL